VSDSSPTALLWTFVAGILALAIVLVAFGAAVVIYQRRYAQMHRAYAQRLLQAQEEERAWVAREVHDDALQRIALIHREVESVRDLEPALSTEQNLRVGAIEEEMKDLSVVLRGLAHRLHPALIEKGGLGVALSGLCGEIERTYPLAVHCKLPERIGGLTPPQALAIYRIAQEAMRNAGTHSGAKEITLGLSQDAMRTELAVIDGGTGFDARSSRPSDGLGLIGMRERALLAGGTLTLTSRPGAGTTVRASFPQASGPPA
jgi:two-component system, NarL family, sensor histidine kinase UhpB